eukprot:9601484-Alexandrium_andersonii.AAC.1
MIEVREWKRLEGTEKLLIWSRVVKKLGGEAQAQQALQDGDVTRIRDPQTGTVKYSFEEKQIYRGKEH